MPFLKSLERPSRQDASSNSRSTVREEEIDFNLANENV